MLCFVQHLMELIHSERSISIYVGLFEELLRFLYHHLLFNGGAIADGKHTLCSFYSKELVCCYGSSTCSKRKTTEYINFNNYSMKVL